MDTNELDRKYITTQCEQPHPDGSKCDPTWDGYGYICTNRILRERAK